jgi:hypothetical protein
LQEREVLQGVQTKEQRAGACISSDRKAVSNLQQGVFCKVAREKVREACRILLKALRGDWSFKTNVQRKQSEVEERGDSDASAAALSESVSPHEKSDIGARSACLRSLRSDGSSLRGASHRQLADEQLGSESSDSVLL